MTAEREQAEDGSASIDAEIKDLERKILEIGGSRLLKQKSTVEGISLHIQLANDEITKAEVAKAKAEKDAAKYTTSIATLEASLAEARRDVEKLTQDIDECVEYINEIKEQVALAQDAAESAREELDSLKADLDEKSDKIQEFRQLEVRVPVYNVHFHADLDNPRR